MSWRNRPMYLYGMPACEGVQQKLGIRRRASAVHVRTATKYSGSRIVVTSSQLQSSLGGSMSVALSPRQLITSILQRSSWCWCVPYP